MPTPVSKKTATIAIIVVLLITGATAYTYTALTAPPTPLTVYALWSGSEQRNFEQVLARFTENTNVSVKYYSYTTQDMLVSVPLQLQSPPARLTSLSLPGLTGLVKSNLNSHP
jgi:ABC-type glycerol-3-phosphate transport system substrate-binding protein